MKRIYVSLLVLALGVLLFPLAWVSQGAPGASVAWVSGANKYNAAPRTLTRRSAASTMLTAVADSVFVKRGAGGPQETTAFPFRFGTNLEELDVKAGELAGGRLVIAWTVNDGSDNIRLQLIHPNGIPEGSPLTVAGSAAPENEPSLAVLTDGRVVVTWSELSGGFFDVKAQTFTITGAPGSATITPGTIDTVADNTAASADTPPNAEVAALADGGYVVVWVADAAASLSDINARIYEQNGSVGSLLPITTTASEGETLPSVAGRPDGGFVATWQAYTDIAPPGPSSGDTIAVAIARFNATGAQQSITSAMDGTVAGFDRAPDIAVLTDNRYVATWSAQQGNTNDIKAWLFNADGTTSTMAPITIVGDPSNGLDNAEYTPSISILNGDSGYAVSWIRNTITGLELFTRTFNLNGTPRGAEVQVTATGNDPILNELNNSTLVLTDGRFLLTWIEPDPLIGPPSTKRDDIRYQFFDIGTGAAHTVSFSSSIPIPTTFRLFDNDGSEVLQQVRLELPFGWEANIGAVDFGEFDFGPGAGGDVPPGHFEEGFLDPWVIDRRQGAAEASFLDSLAAGTAQVSLIPPMGFTNGLITIGVNATSFESSAMGPANQYNTARVLHFDLNVVTNNQPTIVAAMGVTRVQGSPASNSQIATVNDADQTEDTLAVTVNGGAMATVNGVTVSNITVNAMGQVFADVVANCSASNANFMLTVTDAVNATANATLMVTVTVNPAPTVGTYPNATVAPGGSTMVTPTAAPSDPGGAVVSVTASAPGFSGSFSGDINTGVITITGANPPGNYIVTVVVSDNCNSVQRTFMLSVNTTPTITAAMGVTRQQGSAVSNSQIATVMDAEDAETALMVTVDGGAMSTVNGVTVSGLAVNAMGQVTANVEADCTATNASFTLTVTDTLGATANATLMVAVTANAAPTVGTYPDTVVAPGGGATVTPNAAPTDNGSIMSVTATIAPAGFTGTLMGNAMTGAITITNANPVNNYTVTVTVTDNCGTMFTRTFNLLVSACGATLSKPDESFAANGGMDSFMVNIPAGCPWMATTSSPFITINSPIGTTTGPGTVSYTVGSHTNTSPRMGTISVAGQTFTVLQGAMFLDVPVGSLFYTEIGKLSARGVTLGCGGGNYCPNANVTREQTAPLIIRSLGIFAPPMPMMQRFMDVPPEHIFYAFIEEMAVRQITLGCGGGNYCPTAFVTREQMAAFIIRALHVPGYTPPVPAMQRYDDVPPSNIFYAHIEELAMLGITQGCSAMPPLFCPTANVTRAQIAAFLVRAFDL